MLKDDYKIRQVLSSVGDTGSREWKPFRDRLLSDEQLDDLRRTYSPATRRSIESKWGVAGILDTLHHSGDTISAKFRGLLHGYALASHIQHADYIGISIPDERERREPIRRDAIHLAHLSRTISDAFSYFIMRLTSGYKFIREDPAPIKAALCKIDALYETFEGAYEDWMEIEYGGKDSDSSG